MSKNKTLFFINGAVPSQEDRDLAEKLSLESHVVFRNVQWATPEDGIEDFKALAGAIPDFYKDFKKKVDAVVIDEKTDSGFLVPVGNLLDLAKKEAKIQDIALEAKDTPPVSKAKRVKMDLNKKQ